MATNVSKNILKSWFSAKKKPPQEQFWAWMESFWHKDEKIPMASITGLNDLLNSAATAEGLEALRQQVIALQALVDSDDTNLDELQEIVNFIKQNKQTLDALAISNIAGLSEALAEINQRLSDTENRGLQDVSSIALLANEPKSYTLPSNAMLFAIEVRGVGSVQVGNSQSTLGELGEITSAGNSAILQLGLLSIEEVWLQSDADVEVIPIIYKR